MKKIFRTLAILMSMIFLSSGIGCGSRQAKVSTYQFEERVIKTDGQTYTGTDVTYPTSLWTAPEFEYEPTLDFGMENTDGVKGIFYTSPITVNGKPTKVAAYIGFPEGASASNKVPAMVLVHGGWGTAIPQWVKYWNDLGFAAISMDTEGGEPINGVSNEDTSPHLARNRYAGGSQFEAGPTNLQFDDHASPVEDQWMYHATSAVICATSLISSFDCVDTQRIGMTGVSWGSVITSIVIGYDDRITFAMPVYGGVTLSQSFSGAAAHHKTEQSIARWDTLGGLEQTNCNVFYVTSDDDPHFSLDIASRCSKTVGGSVTYINGFYHNQILAAEQENLPMFAKHMCGYNTDFIEFETQPTRDTSSFKLKLYGDAKVNSVWLYHTTSENPEPEAVWNTKFISFEHANEYSYQVPEDATHAYVRVRYNNSKTVCSYLF